MEYFDIFAASGAALGQRLRGEVHRHGFWHRSAHAFVFDGAGRILLQQRAPDKDLYAGCWDYACGEHLHSGESYVRGMRRGLFEELGLARVSPRPMGEVCADSLVWPGGVDAEFQQAFVLRYDGEMHVDPVEVAAVRWVTKAELLVMLDRSPDVFTPWFRKEIARLHILRDWAQLANALS
jgi:isopentenyl-diphosphate Delta-isomerase